MAKPDDTRVGAHSFSVEAVAEGYEIREDEKVRAGR
jgi:hypothetical protein